MLESLQLFFDGIGHIFTNPVVLAYVVGGVLAGTLVGMIPGLGPSTAIALLLPLAMTLQAESALVLMVSIYLGAEYGGRISSILLNIPGDAGAIMTTLDGYPLAKRGEGARALQLSAIASFFGSVLAILGLVLLVGPLAKLAISFGPADYFAVVVMALVLTSTLVGSGLVKSLLSVSIGLMIATVGIDSQTGNDRFTFGSQGLLGGIDLIIVIIGIFGVGEILHSVAMSRSAEVKMVGAKGTRASWQDVRTITPSMGRGSLYGFVAGVLPGAGTTLGAFLGYSMEKKTARNSKTFGTGDIRGVAAPEAANNAAVGGSMVPTLALGIPGSGTAAVLLAYLTMYGLNPGPRFFETQSELAWSVIGALAVAAVVGFVLNLPLAPLFSSVLNIPSHYLYAFILLIALVSGYGLHGSIFEAFLVVVFGIIGFLMRMVNLSSALLVIGVVLGAMLEETMRQGYLLAKGSWTDMLIQPMPLLFFGIALAALVFDFFGGRKMREEMEELTHQSHANFDETRTSLETDSRDPASAGSEDSPVDPSPRAGGSTRIESPNLKSSNP